MSQNLPDTDSKSRNSLVINEVKYSLAELIVEVEEERQNSVLARELVDQAEIAGMMKKNRRRPRGYGHNGRR